MQICFEYPTIDELGSAICKWMQANGCVPNKENEEELFSTKEAALFLKISLQSLSTYTKEGLLTSHHLKGRVYYKKSELLQSLKKAGPKFIRSI
jgi:hypothetical protein